MDGLAQDKGLRAQIAAAKRDYIVEPRLGKAVPFAAVRIV